MKFKSWCLENISKLKLEVKILTWVNLFFPDYYDFFISIEIDNKKIEGQGVDKNKDMAITKAISEAFERSVLFDKDITSNGVAAHENLGRAKENARNELIERDLFLSHFYTSTPFLEVNPNEFRIPRELRKYIEDNHDHVKILKTKKSNYGTTYVAVIYNQKTWGGIISTQICKKANEFEIVKCLISASRTYRYEKNEGNFNSAISLENFSSLKNHTFRDHQSLAFNASYFRLIAHLFLEKGEACSHLVRYEDDDFKFYEMSLSSSLMNCPLHIVRCENQSIIRLSLGSFNKIIVPENLGKRFLNGREYKLNNLPHPLS